MDKLEQYLDQVCRSIGGSRSMRRHVRQELREHLLDAAAQHRAGGLPEDEALDRALAEFGRPDEMRTEMQATHGQRMLAVVIDKSLEWKEKTMRAKWLWTTWATAAVVLVIALAVLFIVATEMLIVPKFNQLVRDGLIDAAIFGEVGVAWMLSWLAGFSRFAEHATWWVLLAAVVWGLFEWRVRSENKTFMRLSALGTAAVGLVAIVWLMGATLLVSFCLAAPANGRMARQFAVDQVGKIEESVAALEATVQKGEWKPIEQHLAELSRATDLLTKEAAALPALMHPNTEENRQALEATLRRAREALDEAGRAVRRKDQEQIASALKRFRTAIEPLTAAAEKPQR
jgi:hypothetical protein